MTFRILFCLWLSFLTTIVAQQEAAIPLDGLKQENNVFDSIGKWFDEAVNSFTQKLQTPLRDNDDERCTTNTEEDSDPFPNVIGGDESITSRQSLSTSGFVSMVQSLMSSLDSSSSSSSSKDDSSSLATLLHTAQKLASSGESSRTRSEELDFLWSHFQQVMDAIQRSFAHVAESIEKLHPLSFWYFIEHEDERKNPSWKRRKHYYMNSVDSSTIEELHDALYLSHLSYAHSIDDIRNHLLDFQDDSWELVYCTVEGHPMEPAHFLAVKKTQEDNDDALLSLLPWMQKPRALQVLLMIRGTKELGDLLSDGLLEPADYRGGKAHKGVMNAGLFVVKKHKKTLEKMLEVSQQDKLHLTIIGHSLGAGAAAIVAMELNDHPQIEATAIGFGCPALVSLNTSLAAKDYITTIVSDSDVIPRMSGATIANMFLDVASYDWTKKGLEDLKDFVKFVNASVPFDVPIDKIVQWADDVMEKEDRPYFKKVTNERVDPVLFPPGDCIHLFRDGFSYTAAHTPCEFFHSIDVARTLMDDHLIPQGYHRVMLSMLRDQMGDYRYDFQHDLMALPV